MISPPILIFSQHGTHDVFGWLDEEGMPLRPIVGNPDGPGVGPWELYYGEDPWRTG